MSVASKRRFITNKVESEMYVPVEGDIIAQVKGSRGNNLHEVLDQNNDSYVVSMPSKFRKAVWIRRGQFVVVRAIDEGDKVKGEIEHVLDEENILYIRECEKWPKLFEAEAEQMTREAKRGGKANDQMIDDDMLPPSDSEEDEEEYEDEEEEAEENSDEEEDEFDTYNPNRMQAPPKIIFVF
ncbi:unnamed protein product [Caenorhabditis angaria]|uniref:Probable RNA-binding protein EIF1AD n=1 Tax=Caenorhabditis angaria TaxID=860376 RepID=A0A9P1N5A6_9PELO|nr:unnamed protein product [Caenorhabditis angaria]